MRRRLPECLTGPRERRQGPLKSHTALAVLIAILNILRVRGRPTAMERGYDVDFASISHQSEGTAR